MSTGGQSPNIDSTGEWEEPTYLRGGWKQVDDHQEGMKPLTWHLKATTGAFTWVPSAMTVRVGRGSHITCTPSIILGESVLLLRLSKKCPPNIAMSNLSFLRGHHASSHLPWPLVRPSRHLDQVFQPLLVGRMDGPLPSLTASWWGGHWGCEGLHLL